GPVLAATDLKLKQVQEEKAVKGRAGPANFKAPTSLETDADEATARKRDEMIEQLKSIIPDMPESESKADLYFQLAEAYWEKSRYISLREMHDYDEGYGKWLKAREAHADSAGPEPKVSTRESDAYRKEALQLYGTTLDKYRDNPRRHEVLF